MSLGLFSVRLARAQEGKESCVARFFQAALNAPKAFVVHHVQDTKAFFVEFKDAPKTRLFYKKANDREVKYAQEMADFYKNLIQLKQFPNPLKMFGHGMTVVRNPTMFDKPDYRMAWLTQLAWDLAWTTAAGIAWDQHKKHGYLPELESDFLYKEIKEELDRNPKMTGEEIAARMKAIDRAYALYGDLDQKAMHGLVDSDVVNFSTLLVMNPNARPVFKRCAPYLNYRITPIGKDSEQFSLELSELAKNGTTDFASQLGRERAILTVCNQDAYRMISITRWVKSGVDADDKDVYSKLVSSPNAQSDLNLYQQKKISRDRLIYLLEEEAANQTNAELRKLIGP